MELLMGLICVGLVLVVQKVHQLQAEVQRLEDRLNEMGDQFTDTKPASEPLGQAEQQTAAEPEAKHFTLARDLKESRLAGKKKETPAPKQPLALPPVIQSPKSVPRVEPAAKPSEPSKPKPVAAAVSAGMPRLPKVDASSIEMKLGTYWFVRIGRDAGADRPRDFGLLQEEFFHRPFTRGQGEFILFAERGDGWCWFLASTHERAV
tara:strand:- start:176 stop:793 length:618 start_codon:yes stop_codon:yes gene_type:complete